MLVCDWLHSVGQNHFYVIMLFNMDSIIFRVFLFRVILLEDSAHISSKSNRIPCNHLDDVIFRPDAQLSKHHPSGPSSMSRSFELLQVASVRTSQKHVGTSLSFWQAKGVLSKTQIWEDNCNHPDDVCSRPDAILDKASSAYKVQPSGRQSSCSKRSSLNMEIMCSWSATVPTLGQHRPNPALFGKEFQANLESRSRSCPSGRPQLPFGHRLEKFH
jgi:hypothetical protein